MIGYDWNQENIKADSVFHSAPVALENSDGALNACKKRECFLSQKSTWALDTHPSTKFNQTDL